MTKSLYVVGNWKMHKTTREAVAVIETLLPLIEQAQAKIWLAVSFTSLAAVSLSAKGTRLVIGAQNMHDAREGAFTGEISSLMLKEAGAHFVLLGHSERRLLFGETDKQIHKKVVRALQDDIIPILCVGETLEEREEGKTEEVLHRQIKTALQGVPKEDLDGLMIAYEPIWAIGTGKSATSDLAQGAHAFIRSQLHDLFGKKEANLPILYGGSVRQENTDQILDQPDIDGILVGFASLDPKTFAGIINSVGIPSRKKS